MKIALFVDAPALWYHAKRFARARVDYAKLRRFVTGARREVTSQIYIWDRPGSDGFTKALRYMGYAVTAIENGTAAAPVMAADILDTSAWCDSIVIVGGDGAMVESLDALAAEGKDVEIWTFPVDCSLRDDAPQSARRCLLNHDVLEVPVIPFPQKAADG